jgi:hypothetical protein
VEQVLRPAALSGWHTYFPSEIQTLNGETCYASIEKMKNVSYHHVISVNTYHFFKIYFIDKMLKMNITSTQQKQTNLPFFVKTE